MKTITLSYTLQTNGKKLAVSLAALFRAVGLDGEVTSAEIPGEVLDTLRVRLVSPGTSGAVELSQNANNPCYYTLDGSNLLLTLSNLVGGLHRLTVLVKYGTNTRALLLVDLSVPQNIQFLKSEGAVLMPLIRKPELDATLEGVNWYGYAYSYGEKIAWLQTDKPLHLHGTIPALYAESLGTKIGDATAITASVVQNAGATIFDKTSAEPITFGAVDTFGSVGGGDFEEEKVTVKLSIPEGADPVNWQSYNVSVENVTAGTVRSVNINENGEATFNIPAGETFIVELPALANYTEPMPRTYIAISSEKTITYEYTTTPYKERIVVYAYSYESSLVRLIGKEAVLTTDRGVVERHAFGDDLRVEFVVNYGDIVTLEYPSAEGLTPRVRTVTFTANRVERGLVVYYDDSRIGVFGRDIAGNWYKLNEHGKLVDESGIEILDPSVVEFVALNTSVLDMSLRDVTGTSTGNGFMVRCGQGVVGEKNWASQNVEFDTNKLPFGTDYRGAKNTEYIRQIGDAMNVDTQAADYAYNQTVTFAGEMRHGFLPAILQLQAYYSNYSALNAVAAAAGRTIPSLQNNAVWSSSQDSSTEANFFKYGAVESRSKNALNIGMIVFYDL